VAKETKRLIDRNFSPMAEKILGAIGTVKFSVILYCPLVLGVKRRTSDGEKQISVVTAATGSSLGCQNGF
jgi:hypothetical protein